MAPKTQDSNCSYARPDAIVIVCDGLPFMRQLEFAGAVCVWSKSFKTNQELFSENLLMKGKKVLGAAVKVFGIVTVILVALFTTAR